MRTAIILLILFLCFSTVSAQSGPRGPVITPDNADQLQLITTLGRGSVYELLWTPDDEQLIVVSGNALSVYTVGEWETPLVITPERPALVDAALAPDGQTIALLERNLIRILDTTTWAEVLRIEATTIARMAAVATIAHMGDYIVHWDPEALGFVMYDAHTGEMMTQIMSAGVGQIVNGSEAFSAVEHYGQLVYTSLAPNDLLQQEGYSMKFASLERAEYKQLDRFTGIDYREHILAVTGVQGEQGYLFVDDLENGTRLAEITTGPLGRVALAPQGDSAAAGSCVEWQEWCRNYQVALLDFSGSEPVPLPGQLRGGVTAIEYSPTGHFLAAASGLAVRVWDTTTQEEQILLHGFSTTADEIAVNDAYLAVNASVYTYGYGVTLWDLNTLRSVAYLPSCVGGVALDDTHLVCGTEVWSLETMPPRLLYRISDIDSGWNVVFSPDGGLLALTDRDHHLLIWDMDKQAVAAAVSGIRLWNLGFAPDGNLFAYDHGARLLMWDIPRLLAEAEPVVIPDLEDGLYDYLDSLPFVTLITTPQPHIYEVAAHPYNLEDTLVYDFEGLIRVFDVTGGEERFTIPFWNNTIMFDMDLTYNPDGDLIAGARCSDSPVGGYCVHSDVQVFDAATGTSLFTEERDSDQINTLAFTPDGRWLVTGHVPLYGMALGPLPDCRIHIWGIPDPG